MSETEPELGLGLVVDVSSRAVQLFYHVANEMRHYALAGAPLQRVRFSEGDTVASRDGEQLKVDSIAEDENGLLSYCSSDGTTLSETDLCDTSSFDQPETRLLAGKVDENELFELRFTALVQRYHYGILPVRGLLGGRVDLLPHQLYIAQEVSERHLPRVLLADEVGLGKTIEACLILHRLMVCGRVKRVLILVPHILMHQWFVELLRRFNLSFSLFDEERCQAIEAGDPETNPFLDDQLVLASIDFLVEQPHRTAQAISAHWDLLIVDEAHHLHWSPESSSPEYAIVERLAAHTPRLLLLTASPEQMGLESHFARLRLLDPKRYPSFESYCEEHEGYAEVARELEPKLDAMDSYELGDELDRHGPGRVIFRNTRRCMSGFPQRLPELLPMQLPADAAPLSAEDPRIEWLVDFLQNHPQEKVLVIGKTQQEVSAIVTALKTRTGIDIAHFHEAMPLVQCDRQAAWFAESEGARIMVVSEMGGEGRNFQMASHLVLFDPPRDPELLEQRIGRLDRIGQRGDVHIHVPYLTGTAEEITVRWLHEGLNAFSEPAVGGQILLEHFGDRLNNLTNALLEEIRTFHTELRERIAAGRDRLLELSSFRPEIGEAIADQIRECEEEPDLQDYLLRLFEQYGIQTEELDDYSYHIRPDQLFCEWFPLREEGLRITFDREEALIRPDTTLMSWDHPMVVGATDLVLGSERGSCSFVVDPDQTIPLKLQAIHLLETVAPAGLDADRFLPPTPIEVTVDHAGELAERPSGEGLKDGEAWRLLEHENVRQQLIPSMIEASRTYVEEAAQAAIAEARRQMRETLGAEFERLEYLKQVNDNVREAELTHARKSMLKLDKALASARLRLDAIRVVSAN